MSPSMGVWWGWAHQTRRVGIWDRLHIKEQTLLIAACHLLGRILHGGCLVKAAYITHSHQAISRVWRVYSLLGVLYSPTFGSIDFSLRAGWYLLGFQVLFHHQSRCEGPQLCIVVFLSKTWSCFSWTTPHCSTYGPVGGISCGCCCLPLKLHFVSAVPSSFNKVHESRWLLLVLLSLINKYQSSLSLFHCKLCLVLQMFLWVWYRTQMAP